MTLSASIHHLKRKARALHRKEQIPLHQALDRIAAAEGYRNWSLLVARNPADMAGALLGSLSPGEMVLLAGRPGQGKTVAGILLAIEASRSGRRSFFFSLEYTLADFESRLKLLGIAPPANALLHFDGSDLIAADHIEGALGFAPSGSVAIVDYLQLLDQRREKPVLDQQLRSLRTFARAKGVVLVFLSQIDRRYDPATKPFPDLGDLRLPNPVETGLFDKAFFVQGGEIRMPAAA
ncbi:DNA helicase [Bosea sp. TND4EK4]|uniref:DNA helicase n=1 Tax=Bosea sp. TND4EK4 TaxID=1907408 RepID=UPI000955EC86|nr:DNA helicase [Bosea sp. TND4EK4]SIQ02890.1 DnaB-like helicase C terminal domain-containing protein [Bosea sp. TND4EK4]